MQREMELSERETQVVKLAAMGLCDKEIAAQMSVSLATVRTYWERVRIKTGARSRTHACCIMLPRLLPAQSAFETQPA